MPSPLAAKDAATGNYEIKFSGRQPDLTEIDALIRPTQNLITCIPVDPNQSDQSLSEALRDHKVGTCQLEVQRVSSRRHRLIKLKIPF